MFLAQGQRAFLGMFWLAHGGTPCQDNDSSKPYVSHQVPLLHHLSREGGCSWGLLDRQLNALPEVLSPGVERGLGGQVGHMVSFASLKWHEIATWHKL